MDFDYADYTSDAEYTADADSNFQQEFEEFDRFKEEISQSSENKPKKIVKKFRNVKELNRNTLFNSIKEKLLSNRSIRVKITKKKNSYHNIYYGYTGDVVDIADFEDGNIIVWIQLENLSGTGRKVIRLPLEHILVIN